jgi:hypothetical protein
MNSVSKAAQAMGRVKSERKAQAAQENGKKGGGQMKALADIPCSCGDGAETHRSTCKRGRAICYRTKKGLPLT